MSSVASLATTAVASSQAQTQSALAAKFAKMNASADQAVVSLIESANANLQQVLKSAVADGVGSRVDISA